MVKYSTKKRRSRLECLLFLLNATNLVFKSSNGLIESLQDIEDLADCEQVLFKFGFAKKELVKLRNPDWRLIAKDLSWIKQDNHNVVTIYDSCYPKFLREISDPPLLLFAIGNLDLLKLPQIAMVGSRNPTPGGLEIAANFAQSLVKAGFVITSGLASGIDGASHRGALDADGKTIAVMGAGLDIIYPAYHKELAQRMVAAGGLLLSEFPLTFKAKAMHFPLRNRIISGLSLGVVVVEATIRSGSLISARFANEQGREVFAIPGSIYNPVARGCHYLISQGAKLVEKPEDICEEFPDIVNTNVVNNFVPRMSKTKNKLDYDHKKLLNCMGFEATTIETIAKRADLSVTDVSTRLLDLELQGLVKLVDRGYVRL